MHWTMVPETFAVGMVVLVFLSIYRERQSICTWNWIAGWIFILAHFVSLAVMPEHAGLAFNLIQVVALASLKMAGVMFFLATIELVENPGTLRIIAASIIVPSGLYIAFFVFQPRPALLEALLAAEFAVLLTLWYRHFRRPELYSFALLAGVLLCCGISFCSFLSGSQETPIIVGLTAIYAFTALSYWRRFRRATPGVIIAVAGFLIWGSIFTVAELVDVLDPGMLPLSSSVWNIPKYIVAAAMILTLLEGEIVTAKQLMRRYQLQFDRSLCGVFRCTASGEMLECNGAFARTFQLNPEQVGLMNLADLLGDHTFLPQLQKQPQLMAAEFAIHGAMGPRFLLGNASLVREPEACINEVEGTILDITELKVLQDQIRESQKLEALGRLAGGVAHDFNNLLMVISGHMELLDEQLTSDPLARSTLEAVKDATHRGAAITGQLLAFSRKRQTEPRRMDMNMLLADTRTLLVPVLGERIKLEIKTGKGKLDVLADENQIVLVLINLVINARDAMPEGGRLLIESSAVELDESLAQVHGLPSAGHYVCVSVNDTGCGIASEVRSRVFEPFFTTKPQGKGTGLGLSICFGILQQHHGAITIASSPGIGSTVRFYLPLQTEFAVRPATAPRPITPSVRSSRILLVDDEEMLRKPACVVFQRAGFQVVEASSGMEALRAFEAAPFDIVISDMVMPGMSGKELGDELRKRAPALPMIYISGYAQDILESQGQLSPGDILLEKPYSLRQLVRLVGDELEKRNGVGRC